MYCDVILPRLHSTNKRGKTIVCIIIVIYTTHGVTQISGIFIGTPYSEAINHVSQFIGSMYMYIQCKYNLGVRYKTTSIAVTPIEPHSYFTYNMYTYCMYMYMNNIVVHRYRTLALVRFVDMYIHADVHKQTLEIKATTL